MLTPFMQSPRRAVKERQTFEAKNISIGDTSFPENDRIVSARLNGHPGCKVETYSKTNMTAGTSSKPRVTFRDTIICGTQGVTQSKHSNKKCRRNSTGTYSPKAFEDRDDMVVKHRVEELRAIYENFPKIKVNAPGPTGPSNCLQKQKSSHRSASKTAARSIQAVARGFIQRQRSQRLVSALRIQTTFRGYMARMKFAIKRLEFRLMQIEKRRQHQLRSIQQRTIRQKKILREECIQEQEALSSQKEKVDELIRHLRKMNRKLREDNERLACSIKELRETNDLLEVNIAAVEAQAAILNVGNETLGGENGRWKKVMKKFEAKRDQYENFLQVRDDYVDFETRTSAAYQNTINAIIGHIKTKSKDKNLADDIVRTIKDED